MGNRQARALAVGIAEDGVAALADALCANGYVLSGRAPDALSGLRLIETLQPELVLAQAIMPGLDGIAFARRVGALRLNLRPTMLLLTPRGLRLPGASKLASMGTLAVEAPLSADALEHALLELKRTAPALPAGMAERLEGMLDALGVPAHPGRACLVLAVTLIWQDRRRLDALSEDLYPELSRRTGMTPAQVRRAIEHAIDAAWKSGDIEAQHRLFGDTIDARRGRPTCSEMIAQLAEELRWEG